MDRICVGVTENGYRKDSTIQVEDVIEVHPGGVMAIRFSVVDLPGNPRELRRKLEPLLGKRICTRLEDDVQRQARALFMLGKGHYLFAKRLEPGRDWRQIVSRSYYGGYNVSRAVRLMVSGEFSRDSKDHQKFDRIPDDFPNVATYTNKLELLRDDRNLCDYHQMARVSDLSSPPADILKLVGDFIVDAKRYLAGKGLVVR